MLKADVAALWDDSAYNAGFIIIKPTNASKRLYHTIRSMTNKSRGMDDQSALNRAIGDLRKQNSGLKVTVLNKQRFLCGLHYFERRDSLQFSLNRHKCNRQNQSNCVAVVHNNWMVGKAAKVYRFREHLMWMYDGDDQYYTSNTRLYLTYTNQAWNMSQNMNQNMTTDRRTVVVESEISALKIAMTIGYILNRTVILPRFHTGSKLTESTLGSVLHIQSFDNDFSGKYRENSFLLHSRVPIVVKSGLSKQRLVDNLDNSFSPRRQVLSDTDITSQFGNLTDKVLTFESLDNIHIVLGNSTDDFMFTEKLRRSFLHGDYRQFKRW